MVHGKIALKLDIRSDTFHLALRARANARAATIIEQETVTLKFHLQEK
jgi:hypothetical protein